MKTFKKLFEGTYNEYLHKPVLDHVRKTLEAGGMEHRYTSDMNKGNAAGEFHTVVGSTKQLKTALDSAYTRAGPQHSSMTDPKVVGKWIHRNHEISAYIDRDIVKGEHQVHVQKMSAYAVTRDPKKKTIVKKDPTDGKRYVDNYGDKHQ